MPPPLRVPLDPAEQAELEHRYRTTRDAETRTRYQMVLLSAQGHSPPQIALLVRCSPDTIRRVLKRYLAGGPDAVPHRPHLGQPPHYPPGWEQELVRVADLDPHEVGVDSALWTCRLLADYLAKVTGHRAGIETVRIALHRAGFVCKRPRWVLETWASTPPRGRGCCVGCWPTYDPDANRIEWLWRALRRTVTHTHQRQRLDDLLADADRWARTIPAAKVLSQIGSPFAPDQQPVPGEELNHAA